MRLLLVSPVPFCPSDAGNRARIRTLIDEYEASGIEVFFAYLPMESGDVEAMKSRLGRRFREVPYSRGRHSPRHYTRRFARRLMRSRYRDFRYALDEWADSSAASRIRELCMELEIDAVQVEYVFLSWVLPALPDGILRIIDTHDVFSDRHERYRKAGLKPEWYSLAGSDEGRGLDRADVVIAIQEHEAELLQTKTRSEVVTIGHFVSVAEPDPRIGKDLLFVGSANPINRNGILWFLEEVWPLVRQKSPGASIRIAGDVCRQLDPREGVELLGRVDSLESAYREARCVVCPLLAGTGLKIKAIEALGYGRPVVATPVGSEGLEDAEEKGLAIASDPARYAEHCLRWISSEEEASRAGSQARDFAYRWNDRQREVIGSLRERSQLRA